MAGDATASMDAKTQDHASTPVDGQALDSSAGLGAACSADTDCPLGFCTDHVCCESRCHGVCETCGAKAFPGRCIAIPAGTDPRMECVVAPSPDAGSPPPVSDGGVAMPLGGDAAATGDAAASGDSSAGDGAPAMMGLGYNPPDGGVTTDPTQCAGTCNGARACAFPGATKSCGTPFCNTSSQQAGFACDGVGNCALSLNNCSHYACEGSACGTSCTSQADCLSTAFCNSLGLCQAQKGDGVACSLPTECQHDNCIQGVCCNTDCSSIPGGTCKQAGSVGQCICPKDCGDGGSCELFYQDADSDGFGNPNVSVVGCSGLPPAGYVANNTDCDDANANAYPGQTAYFSTPRSNGSYDYNCDGSEEGTNAVYPGGTCGYCEETSSGCTNGSESCGTAGQQGYMSCRPFIGVLSPVQVNQQTVQAASAAIIFPRYCFNDLQYGFTGTAACGKQAPYLYCGTCSAVGGAPYADHYTQPFPCR
ncbi:MAG: hypothetical protein ACREJ3_00515 [Polyangiaceae bacterium]